MKKESSNKDHLRNLPKSIYILKFIVNDIGSTQRYLEYNLHNPLSFFFILQELNLKNSAYHLSTELPYLQGWLKRWWRSIHRTNLIPIPNLDWPMSLRQHFLVIRSVIPALKS